MKRNSNYMNYGNRSGRQPGENKAKKGSEKQRKK